MRNKKTGIRRQAGRIDKKSIFRKVMYSMLAFILLLVSSGFAIENPVGSKNQVQQWIRTKPVQFIENGGQITDMNNKPVPFVLFKAEAPNLNIWVTTSGLTYQFHIIEDEHEKKETHSNSVKGEGQKDEVDAAEKIEKEWHRVDMILKGANIKKENIITEGDITRGGVNYYLSHCPEGIFNVKTYTKITIREVYNGIDWVLYTSKEGGIKHDFVVHPHADPNQIKLIYEGSGKFNMKDNQIYFKNELGKVTEGKLFCYQENESNAVKSNYSIKENTSALYSGAGNISVSTSSSLNKNLTEHSHEIFSYEIGIETDTYNTNQILTIDPQLVWSTFYGGNGDEGPLSVDTDSNGNLFVVGYTSSSTFPVQNAGTFFQGTSAGSWDAFILKFNNAGTLLWATFYAGSVDDFAVSIDIEGSGNVFITGYSSSTNFPVQNAGTFFQGTSAGGNDVFILKFDNAGNRLWATYYGGTGNERASSIVADGTGNVFVTGYVQSLNFPVQNAGTFFQGVKGGGEDAFILKFDNAGNRLWATYYGGSGDERASAIAADGSGNVFITGHATVGTPTPFPLQNTGTFFQGINGGAQDAFILKFDTAGNRLWATFYGGNGNDMGCSIATDATGNMFVTGNTQSTNFPVQNAGTFFQGTNAGVDVFILKFDNVGNRLWGTYLGGGGLEQQDPMGSFDNLAISSCGNVYMGFNTTSLALLFQISCDGGYYDNSFNGNLDPFLALFSNTGVLLWSTYIGGNGMDFRTVLAIDPNDNLFAAGEWTNSNSATYPVNNPGGGAYYDPTFNGGLDDVYILKFIPASIVATTTVTQPPCDNPCGGSAVVNINSPSGCTYTYLWLPGNMTTQTVTGLCVGAYSVTVANQLCKDTTLTIVITGTPCGGITANVNSAETCSSATSCPTLTATGASGTPPYTYSWSTAATTASISPCPASTTNYTVTITDNAGAKATSFAVVIVNPAVNITIVPTNINCYGGTGTASAVGSGGTASYNYSWSNGNTTSQISNLPSQIYTVTITDSKGCTSVSTAAITTPLPLFVQFTKGTANCGGCGCKEWIMVNATGGTSPYNYLWPDGYVNRYKNNLCSGPYSINIKDKNGCSVNANLSTP